MFKRFDRWAKDGTWQRILTAVQTRSNELGKLDWVVSIDSTITRVHQHGATLTRSTGGAQSNYKILGPEPPDHAIGRSRGGLTGKIHLVADGRGRPLSMVLTPGNINDTTMLAGTIELISVPTTGAGRARTRPDRVLADKGYPSRANRSYLASRGIKATIPDKADQLRNRINKGTAGGRPTAFDPDIYKGRNVVERSFNRLKNWRGIAMRSDKTARNYQAGVTVAAILIWLNTDLFNTP